MKKHKTKIAFVVSLFIVWFLVRDCHADKPATTHLSIAPIVAKRDSVLLRVDTIEKVRTKIVIKWKEVRHTDTIPCEEKLILCDTIIQIDSTEISLLKTVIKLDSSIISNQGLAILSQEDTIKDLNKQVKKERRKKRLWQILTGVSIGAALTNR